MSSSPSDFRVEIIPCRPQGVANATLGAVPSATPVDITSRVARDGLGSINRALERDLLSFKTGDLTLVARNRDGFFDDLFAFFGPNDMWSLRVYRRGEVQFWGLLIGKGSITFDRKARECEITVYGLTKLLDTTSSDAIQRSTSAMTFVGAVPGTITLNTTSGLLSGDVLHVTDQQDAEDFTVKRVLSGTTLEPEAALVSTYDVGSPVTLETPFPRFKTIDYLVDALFTAAGIPLTDLRLSASQFDRLAPTPVNLEGLSLANNPRRGMSQWTEKWNVGIHGVDDYSQGDPDEAWSVQGFPDQGLFDYTPYYAQGTSFPGSTHEGEPAFGMFEPVVGSTQETVGAGGEKIAAYWGAVDHRDSGAGVRRVWGIRQSTGGVDPVDLIQRTTVNGLAYAALTVLGAFPGSGWLIPATSFGMEYDPVRNVVFVSWYDTVDATARFQYWDLNAPGWVDCKQTDDVAGTGYYGPRYIAELDVVIAMRQTGGTHTGPNFDICAFRGTSRIWKRTFPGCLIYGAIAGNPAFYPSRTARYVNGLIYVTLSSDQSVQLLWTDDEFQTYTMRKIVDGTANGLTMACRIGDTYRLFCYNGSDPRGYYICAPMYGGVIEYADFAEMSCADALKKLAILSNAVFWVDDDLQGHFVARDLLDPDSVTDIGDRIMEQKDDLIWDETAQFVTVSGNNIEATAGDSGFATEGVSLETSLLPTEAFAQALADSMYGFYSAQRRMVEVTVIDRDGRIYRPLDRVTLGGPERYLVYESDHSLVDDEVSLTLLEDR